MRGQLVRSLGQRGFQSPLRTRNHAPGGPLQGGTVEVCFCDWINRQGEGAVSCDPETPSIWERDSLSPPGGGWFASPCLSVRAAPHRRKDCGQKNQDDRAKEHDVSAASVARHERIFCGNDPLGAFRCRLWPLRKRPSATRAGLGKLGHLLLAVRTLDEVARWSGGGGGRRHARLNLRKQAAYLSPSSHTAGPVVVRTEDCFALDERRDVGAVVFTDDFAGASYFNHKAS